MTPILACVVCARPLDSLLTGGLQSGVAVLAAIAVLVIGGLVRGAVAVARADAADARRHAGIDTGATG